MGSLKRNNATILLWVLTTLLFIIGCAQSQPTLAEAGGPSAAGPVMVAQAGGGDPAAIAKTWRQAIIAGDAATVAAMSCRGREEYYAHAARVEAGRSDTKNSRASLSCELVRTEGNEAYVKCDGTATIYLLDQQTSKRLDEVIILLQEGGSWKPCIITDSSALE